MSKPCLYHFLNDYQTARIMEISLLEKCCWIAGLQLIDSACSSRTIVSHGWSKTPPIPMAPKCHDYPSRQMGWMGLDSAQISQELQRWLKIYIAPTRPKYVNHPNIWAGSIVVGDFSYCRHLWDIHRMAPINGARMLFTKELGVSRPTKGGSWLVWPSTGTFERPGPAFWRNGLPECHDLPPSSSPSHWWTVGSGLIPSVFLDGFTMFYHYSILFW